MKERLAPLAVFVCLICRVCWRVRGAHKTGRLRCGCDQGRAPGYRDDTRSWARVLEGPDGNETTESAYYLSTNRNKRSVAIDFSKPEAPSWCAKWPSTAIFLSKTSRWVGLKVRTGLRQP